MEIIRHDIRHFIENISSLIKAGDISAALDFIGKKDTNFNKIIFGKYCENSKINAILSHYLNLIKEDGIIIKHKLYIPEYINVDEMELSNFFAMPWRMQEMPSQNFLIAYGGNTNEDKYLFLTSLLIATAL